MSKIRFLSLFTWLNLGIILKKNTTTGPDVSINAETDLTKSFQSQRLVKVRHL